MPREAQSRKGSRFARRTEGPHWRARVEGLEGRCRVVNVSRKGIALETDHPLEEGRHALVLEGPAGSNRVDFYVVRCAAREGTSPGRKKFEIGGVFSELLVREDLPEELS